MDGAAGRWTKTLAVIWRVESVVVDVGRWTKTLVLVCIVEGMWEGRRRTSRSFEKQRIAVGHVGSTKALTLVWRA